MIQLELGVRIDYSDADHDSDSLEYSDQNMTESTLKICAKLQTRFVITMDRANGFLY
jgi:hypothetical protein